MWQSRRWRHLLSIIDGLPRHSAFGESLANDEELAHAVVDRMSKDGGKDRPPTRSMRDFTVEVEVQSVIADRLTELIQVVAATKGARSRQLHRMPRPVTAMQRVLAQRRRAKHESVVARVLPGRAAEQPVRRRRLGRPSRASRDEDVT